MIKVRLGPLGQGLFGNDKYSVAKLQALPGTRPQKRDYLGMRIDDSIPLFLVCPPGMAIIW